MQGLAEVYRQIFNLEQDAIILYDAQDFMILAMNASARDMFGVQADEVEGLTLADISADVTHYEEQIKNAIAVEDRIDFNTTQYRKDGKEHFIQVSALAIEQKGQRVVIGIHQDITRRKLVEVRLDINARRLKAMNQMGQIVTSSLELSDVLHRVTREAQLLMGVETISVMLRENEDELTFVAVSDAGSSGLRGMRIPVTAGVAGKVMQTGKAVLVNKEDEQVQIYRAIDQITGYDTRSLLAVPLILNNTVIGVVEALHRELNFFTEDDLNTLEGVAVWAAIAISNARQYTTIQERLRESEAIIEIARSLLGTLNLEDVLQMIVDSAHQLISNVDRAVIHLVDERDNTLVMSAATGFESLQGPFFTIHPGEGVAGKVLAEGMTINVADTLNDSNYLPLGAKDQSGSLLVAPIQSGADLLGTISVRSLIPSAFSADHERLLTLLGVQAALAINNARLFEAEQESRQLAESLLEHEKSTRSQLVQSEKLAALGRIVASVAHELNNPLHAIHNALYLVKQEAKMSVQTQEDLQVAMDETNRMANLIARLRDTYRPTTYEEFHPEALNEIIEDVYHLLSTHMRHKNIRFVFEPDADLPVVPVIRDQIRQVILNISLNAIESMPEGGELTIRTQDHPSSGEVLLAFSDNGPGIPADILANIFDPFFTTKASGTGLGLSITYDIVQRHHGRIDVDNGSERGTTFNVWLPKGQPLIEQEGKRPTALRSPRRNAAKERV